MREEHNVIPRKTQYHLCLYHSILLQVSRLLERLEEMHVHWATYQTQMDQLQEWCGQARTALTNLDLTPHDQEKLKEQFNLIWVR